MGRCRAFVRIAIDRISIEDAGAGQAGGMHQAGSLVLEVKSQRFLRRDVSLRLGFSLLIELDGTVEKFKFNRKAVAVGH